MKRGGGHSSVVNTLKMGNITMKSDTKKQSIFHKGAKDISSKGYSRAVVGLDNPQYYCYLKSVI